MTSNHSPETPGRRGVVVRELFGLALIVLAVVGSVTVAFLTDWRLGAALLCVYVGGLGALLVFPDDDQLVT